jgi:hypothetical protein
MDFLKNILNSPTVTSMAASNEPTVAVVKSVHPYYPTNIEIVGFAANSLNVIELLTYFAAGCTTILGLTWFLASSFAPRLRTGDKFTALWFCLCKRKKRCAEVLFG